MKKILLFLFLGLTLIDCKKNPFDFRSMYTGDYSFLVHTSSYNPVDGPFDTTYSINGNIKNGSNENSISIYFENQTVDELTIYEDGSLDGNHCSGEFETSNKIKYSCNWYSPSFQFYEIISGKKND